MNFAECKCELETLSLSDPRWAPRCVWCWIDIYKNWPESRIQKSDFDPSFGYFAEGVRSIPALIKKYFEEHPEKALE